MFKLHPRLAADTSQVLKLELCRVLLMNDRAVPWLILVPERHGVSEQPSVSEQPGLVEMHHLPPGERALLMEEIALASSALEALHPTAKLNVGALGNMVPQLHVHVIARFPGDRAWPGPIWGTGPVEPYPPEELERTLERLRAEFTESRG